MDTDAKLETTGNHPGLSHPFCSTCVLIPAFTFVCIGPQDTLGKTCEVPCYGFNRPSLSISLCLDPLAGVVDAKEASDVSALLDLKAEAISKVSFAIGTGYIDCPGSRGCAWRLRFTTTVIGNIQGDL